MLISLFQCSLGYVKTILIFLFVQCVYFVFFVVIQSYASCLCPTYWRWTPFNFDHGLNMLYFAQRIVKCNDFSYCSNISIGYRTAAHASRLCRKSHETIQVHVARPLPYLYHRGLDCWIVQRIVNELDQRTNRRECIVHRQRLRETLFCSTTSPRFPVDLRRY